eukprot:m.134402 g.134402  ORF g.134402 m.134402 type:complete len:260 (-) comp9594_c0_seq1:846-1625(-)
MVVFAFDFDGVLVDSARETGLSGLKCYCKVTGKEFPQDETELNNLLDEFEIVRPSLETGWEAVVIMHGLYTNKLGGKELQKSFQTTWKEKYLLEVGSTEEELKEYFNYTRIEWIEEDTEGWLQSHGFYEDACSYVRNLTSQHKDKVYVITTKGTLFAQNLCEKASLGLCKENVFGLESGKKWDTLSKLMKRHEGEEIVFVEDRLKTLVDVHNRMEGDGAMSFYLVDYGYNTEQQLEEARSSHSIYINVISTLSDIKFHS